MLTGDVLKVKDLLTNSLNAISQYRNNSTLWIQDKATDFWVKRHYCQMVVSALASKIPLCPRLETVCIADPRASGVSFDMVGSVIEGTGVSLHVSKRPHPPLPGSPVSSCAYP
jgi:hypothetical protein